MAKLDYILFEHRADTFLEFIAKCKADLEQYAERDDAKQTYIDKRNAEIATMYTFYTHSTEATTNLFHDTQSELSRGIDIGYKRKEKELETIPERYYDKEGARAYSITRAMQAQPDLFQPFNPQSKIEFQK